MLELTYIRYEEKGPVAIITINRPDARNAMSPDCWREFNKCMDQVESNPELRVLVITGAGEKAFIAGADIKELNTRTPGFQLYHPISLRAIQRLEDLPIPVIAAVNGVALGAGCETTLACDIRIASTRAKFGLPEVNLGILPGAGGTQRLARIVGLGRAKEIILAGRILNAQEAYESGLVMKVVEPEALMDAVMEVANTIIKKAPLSIAISKKVLNLSLDVDRASGIAAEQLGFMTLLGSSDKAEGTSAFIEKRDSHFTGK